LHRKRKHAPEPDLINAASHNKAFDRIFLCDYMFRFVDSAFNTLLKNRLKLAEIRKKCAEAPHVQGISGDGEEESEAENSCYSDEEEEEEKIIFKRVLEAACEYTNTGGNTFHEGQREVYYRPGHFSSETRHDAAYAFYMARRTAFLFNNLQVHCKLSCDGRFFITLDKIFAVDRQPMLGGGYLHSIIQGLKMGIIANEKHFLKIGREIFDGDGVLKVILKVSSPNTVTTLEYLQNNEGYPKDSQIQNYRVKDQDTYANSLMLQLMQRGSEPGEGWYWEVYTDDSLFDDDSISYKKEEVSISEEEEKSIKLSDSQVSYEKEEVSISEEEEKSIKLSDSQVQGVITPMSFPYSRMNWIISELMEHNKNLQADNAYQLVRYKPRSIIFCLESCVGRRILSEIGSAFWDCVRQRLDETFNIPVMDDGRRVYKKGNVVYASKKTGNEKQTLTNPNMHLLNPMMFATLSNAFCNATFTPKKMPEYAYSAPMPGFKASREDGLTEENYPISNFMLDFDIEFDKRAAFGYMRLAEGVLQRLIRYIGDDLLVRGDMFVRSLSVRETCTELGTAHPARRSYYNFLLYGQGLQLDRTQDPNDEERPRQQSRVQQSGAAGGKDAIMQGARLCCQRCSGEFSLLRSLEHFHKAHILAV
jgi:hypothetical protein